MAFDKIIHETTCVQQHTLPLSQAASFKSWTFQNNITIDKFSCPILPDSYLPNESINLQPDRSLKIWLHGLVAIFAISICAIFGAVIVPYAKKHRVIFNLLMLYLISLAVSALSGAAILVLIPEGLGLMDCDLLEQNGFVCLGIICCYIVNQIIKYLVGINESGYDGHGKGHLPKNHSEYDMITGHCSSFDSPECQSICSDQKLKQAHSSQDSSHDSNHVSNSLIYKLKKLKPVGWLCLIGDAIHNLLDGIAIGATFSLLGISKGWQMTIAIFAEEFPHELGDFAVLIKAGLTTQQAIICNLFSAATALLGFFIGMFFGEHLHHFVFGWMGGVFLFISLSSMLPEVDEHIVALKKDRKVVEFVCLGESGIVLISCLGLLTGYLIVFGCGYVDFDGLVFNFSY